MVQWPFSGFSCSELYLIVNCGQCDRPFASFYHMTCWPYFGAAIPNQLYPQLTEALNPAYDASRSNGHVEML